MLMTGIGIFGEKNYFQIILENTRANVSQWAKGEPYSLLLHLGKENSTIKSLKKE